MKEYIKEKIEFKIFSLQIKNYHSDKKLKLYQKPFLISLIREKEISFLIKILTKLGGLNER